MNTLCNFFQENTSVCYSLPIELWAYNILSNVQRQKAIVFIQDPILRELFLRHCKDFIFYCFNVHKFKVHEFFRQHEGVYFHDLISEAKINPNTSGGRTLKWASICGFTSIVKSILEDPRLQYYNNGSITSVNIPKIFIKACKYNRLEIVKLYIEGKHIEKYDCVLFKICCLEKACQYGAIDVFHYLLEEVKVDPSSNNDSCIIIASENGWLDIVKLLLKDERVDPNVQDGRALIEASYQNHIEIVKEFLKHPKTNPCCKHYTLLQICVYKELWEILDLFLEDPRLDGVAYEKIYNIASKLSFDHVTEKIQKIRKIRNM
jgi:hypothetical protein